MDFEKAIVAIGVHTFFFARTDNECRTTTNMPSKGPENWTFIKSETKRLETRAFLYICEKIFDNGHAEKVP